jgi:hypothetical protein
MRYSRTIEVATDADRLFAYVGNPEKLPQFVPSIVHARRTGGKVKVAVTTGGSGDDAITTYDAWLRVDPRDRRVEWGVDGPKRYGGELIVRPTSRGARVEVLIDTDQPVSTDVNHDLGDALAEVKRVMEASGKGLFGG